MLTQYNVANNQQTIISSKIVSGNILFLMCVQNTVILHKNVTKYESHKLIYIFKVFNYWLCCCEVA